MAVEVPHELARRLVDKQFPQWRDQPLSRVDPAGSDHVIYRLGRDLSVRLPRHDGAVGQAAKEFHWLPLLAPHLPLAIPVPLGVGEPDFGLGDPACDLTIAFTLMSPRTRPAFRAALGVDDATWTRGRGWALASGLNAYTSFAAVDPRVAALTNRQITQVLLG